MKTRFGWAVVVGLAAVCLLAQGCGSKEKATSRVEAGEVASISGEIFLDDPDRVTKFTATEQEVKDLVSALNQAATTNAVKDVKQAWLLLRCHGGAGIRVEVCVDTIHYGEGAVLRNDGKVVAVLRRIVTRVQSGGRGPTTSSA